MISARKEVLLSKGKKILNFVPDEVSREEILNLALGRSGSLRAPAVDTGDKMIIGYAEGIYDGL